MNSKSEENNKKKLEREKKLGLSNLNKFNTFRMLKFP